MIDPTTWLIGNVLWGSHEEMAEASHRPEAVRRLFCDANASFGFAERIIAALREHPEAVRSLLSDELLADIRRCARAGSSWSSTPSIPAARRVLAWLGEQRAPIDLGAAPEDVDPNEDGIGYQ